MSWFALAAPQAQDRRFPSRRLLATQCMSRAHDRENLGLGGRRVLVSRHWSGKTLAEHKADRSTVVRDTQLSAGMVAPEIEPLAASVRATDGLPRYVWTDEARPCQVRADDPGRDH